QLNNTQPVQATPPGRPAAPPRALDIKAFFGSFAGSGVADGEDTTYLGVTQRDLDVRIASGDGGGFTVTWTTVLRTSNDQPTRRRQTTMAFVPGPQQGIFRATDNGDPLKGEMISWANIRGNTLTLHQFSVLPDGRHEIQTYARTMSAMGME